MFFFSTFEEYVAGSGNGLVIRSLMRVALQLRMTVLARVTIEQFMELLGLTEGLKKL